MKDVTLFNYETGSVTIGKEYSAEEYKQLNDRVWNHLRECPEFIEPRNRAQND